MNKGQIKFKRTLGVTLIVLSLIITNLPMISYADETSTDGTAYATLYGTNTVDTAIKSLLSSELSAIKHIKFTKDSYTPSEDTVSGNSIPSSAVQVSDEPVAYAYLESGNTLIYAIGADFIYSGTDADRFQAYTGLESIDLSCVKISSGASIILPGVFQDTDKKLYTKLDSTTPQGVTLTRVDDDQVIHYSITNGKFEEYDQTSGAFVAESGTTYPFTIQPDDGYEIDTITVNGKQQEEISESISLSGGDTLVVVCRKISYETKISNKSETEKYPAPLKDFKISNPTKNIYWLVLSSPDTAEENIKNQYPRDKKKISVGAYYDFSLKESDNPDGVDVTDFGTCTITVPLSDDLINAADGSQSGELVVVTLDADGKIEKLDYKSDIIADSNYNCVQFSTTHFSEFAILYLVDDDSETGESGEGNTPETSDDTKYYTISVKVDSTELADSAVTVKDGEDATVSVKVDAGYQIASAEVLKNSSGPSDTSSTEKLSKPKRVKDTNTYTIYEYTIYEVDQDYTLEIQTKEQEITYTIKVDLTAGEGTVNINGEARTIYDNGSFTQELTKGEAIKFSVTPGSGYILDAVSYTKGSTTDGGTTDITDQLTNTAGTKIYSYNDVLTADADYTFSVKLAKVPDAHLNNGRTVNNLLKQLVESSASYLTADSSITAFRWDPEILGQGQQIQVSGTPVYVTFDRTDNTIHIYSEATTIYANPDSSYLFYNFTAATDLSGLSGKIDTSEVTDMTHIFEGDIGLTDLDLKNFDLSALKEFGDELTGCDNLETITSPHSYGEIASDAVKLPATYYYNDKAYTALGAGAPQQKKLTKDKNNQVIDTTTHIITASIAGETNGGTLSPSGKIEVNDGGDVTLKYTVNSGYQIQAVQKDGVSLKLVNSSTGTGAEDEFDITLSTYVFKNVHKDHEFVITFAKTSSGSNDTDNNQNSNAGSGGTYVMTSAKEGVTSGGYLDRVGNASVRGGNSFTYNFYPYTGYKISYIKVDGVVTENYTGRTYTFSNISGNHSFAVAFAADSATTTTYYITPDDERAEKENTSAISVTVTGVPTGETYRLILKDTTAPTLDKLIPTPANGQLRMLAPFDLSLVDSTGNTVNAFGTCSIILPIPSSMLSVINKYPNGSLTVVSVKDGALERIPTTKVTNNGAQCVSFTTTHFSEYGILYLYSTAASGTSNGSGTSGNTGSGIVGTGGSSNGTGTGTSSGSSNSSSSGGAVSPDSSSGGPNLTDLNDALANRGSTASGTTGIGDGGSAISTGTNTGGNGGSSIAGPARTTGGDVNNANDMPRTGDQDIFRLLFALIIFLLGCIEIVSAIPNSRRKLA